MQPMSTGQEAFSVFAVAQVSPIWIEDENEEENNTAFSQLQWGITDAGLRLVELLFPLHISSKTSPAALQATLS
jgi:hypothetical protein